MTGNAGTVPAVSSAIALANWLIRKNWSDPCELTHLKIENLLRFAQPWHLAYHDVPIFDAPAESWTYRPAIPAVYNALISRKKNDNMTEPIMGQCVRDGA